jgi:hypothetical protein
MNLLLKLGKIFRISDGCPGFNYSATPPGSTFGASTLGVVSSTRQAWWIVQLALKVHF